MSLYAIGDLHLSHAVNKPMDVFGEAWNHHVERIAHNWRTFINETDTVLIPGDISWAMTNDEVRPDLEWIGRLPGKKVMIRGNHDYWWNGIGKVRGMLAQNTFAIQNDSMNVEGYAIAGTRGWITPNHPNFGEEDERMVNREIHRLRLSLDDACRHELPIICMLHYPPLTPDGEETPFTKILDEYPVQRCIYGHLHSAAHRFAVNLKRGNVAYQLVSADFIDFSPVALDSEHQSDTVNP